MTEPEQITEAEQLAVPVWMHRLASKIVLGNHGVGNAGVLIQRAFEEQERELREQNDSLRHWAWGHIDALLLYAAGQYPKDSHVKDAVAFCRALYPKKKLRMDPLEAAALHPATQALATRQLTPTEGSSDDQ